ncbi:retrotransposon protein, putative, ty1-copia subclass [Tanacetum coccineum]
MRALLIQHGCEAALEVLPDDMEAQAKAELNKKAYSAMILCLGNKVLREVTGETTAAGVWTKLETLYMTKSLANKLYLKKKLYTFYMPAGRKISEHIDEFNKNFLDLANIEVKFEDEDLALLLLTSLPASYEPFVDTLLYGREALTLEDVMTTLNLKEIKERSKAKGDDGEGLYVRGRTDRRDSRQLRGKSGSKSRGGRLKCYIFQSEDHLKRNCPKNNHKKSTGYVKKDDQPSSSGSIYDHYEVMVVMSAEALLDLIMDSGCSYHMTPRLDILFDFLECDGGNVLLGDNRECKIRGIGKVLKKQGLFGKESLGKLDFYENCDPEKSHRVSFSVGRHTTQGVINYVHSELWGPSQVESLGGKRYFLSIVHDYSRRVWVYILRFKHKAFGKFKEWKQLVKNQTGRIVKKLRTDNGLEFCNQEFEQLCIESGIARHLTVTGTSQQNGLVERMNRTLMDKPSTAIEKKTPMEMWSGHQSDYGMLRIFGCVAYSHVKQAREPRPGRVTRRFAVPDLAIPARPPLLRRLYLRVSAARVPVPWHGRLVEVELQRLNNHTLEEDQTDKEDGDDESNMAAYAFSVVEKEDTHEPLTYQEAVACEDSSKWKSAMEEEMDSLRKNKTWELVDPLANYELEQLDVKTAFLHGNLEEVIYMKQPPGYEQGNKVCLLKKSLYGLKQSPRQWYRRFDEYMLSNGFKRSSYDSCVYYRSYAPGEYIYLLLYVDDMLIACKSKAEIGSTKSLLKKEFDMKELGEAKKILGMEIVRDRSRKILRVSQSGYVSKILNNFRIDNGKSVKMPLGGHFKLSLKDCPVRDCDVERMSKVPYANAVGSLMYLMVCTRPDIAYARSSIWPLTCGCEGSYLAKGTLGRVRRKA